MICTLSVVILHANNCFWTFSSTEYYWKTANIIECVFYFGVPIFFMISGITLINYKDRYSTKTFFLKRFHKTVLPYIAWSIIGAVFMFLKGAKDLSLLSLLNEFLTGKTISIYWFFPVLFCLFLSFPLFAATPKDHRKNTFGYLFIAALIINTAIPFCLQLLRVFLDITISFPYSIAVLANYLIWPVCGYLLYYYPPSGSLKLITYFFSITGLLLHIIGTEILSYKADAVDQTFKGYNNLPCVLYSVGVFMFLYDIAGYVVANKKIEKIVSELSSYTFAIYLMHWYILEILKHFLKIDNRSIIWRLGAPIPVCMIVILITFIMRKIPIIKKIVP